MISHCICGAQNQGLKWRSLCAFNLVDPNWVYTPHPHPTPHPPTPTPTPPHPMRNSVFNCPWKSFQLKSLHFLGMFLLMKFCENHSPQAMLTSGNFLLQYSFEATSVFLLRRNASYISLEVRRCSDFVSLLQMLKSISRILLILFPIFFHNCASVFSTLVEM